MPIRVQPKELKIPEDNPFCPDNLERKPLIKALTTAVGEIDGPAVIAIDASWGMGKTTFMRMWARYLKNEKFPVVEFNAWETDYAGQPFVALTSEVTNGLRGLLDDLDNPRFKSLVESSGRVLSSLSAPAVRLAASTVPLMGNQLVEELDRDPSTLAETMTADYRSMKEAMSEFRERLEKMAEEAAAVVNSRPLVVLIDELDRCRPTYAIELLETAKHFFSVDHVVFVVCLDLDQLAQSVRAVYGSGFAAEGYLRRFFNLDYRLPDPDRGEFIKSTLDSLGISEHLATSARIHHCYPPDPERLPAILDQDTLSLRDLQQMIHRLAIMLSSASPDRDIHSDILGLLLVLRTVDPDLYRRMQSGKATDEGVIAALSRSAIRQKKYGATIEALASACVSHSVVPVNRTIDTTTIPNAMKRLVAFNEISKPSIETSQPQHAQPQSTAHPGTSIQERRAKGRDLEYLGTFIEQLDDFFSVRNDGELSLVSLKRTNLTQNCLRLLELFPDPAAT